MNHWRNTERSTTAECAHCLHHTGRQIEQFDGRMLGYEVICCHCGMLYVTPHAPLTHGRFRPGQAAHPQATGDSQ